MPTQRGLIRDESGQASAEYILLLVMIVAMVVLVLKNLVKPTFERLSAAISRKFEEGLFPSGDGFHRLRISR